MTVVPSLNAQHLGDITPGGLVRVRFGSTTLLGVVAGCDFYQIPSGKVIIMLEAHPTNAFTRGCFMPIEGPMVTETVLSYGTGIGIVVDPASPVALGVETNGALLVGSDVTAICTRHVRNGAALMIDTGAWQALRDPILVSSWRIAVLEWELRFLIDPPLDPPLPPFRFRVEG